MLLFQIEQKTPAQNLSGAFGELSKDLQKIERTSQTSTPLSVAVERLANGKAHAVHEQTAAMVASCLVDALLKSSRKDMVDLAVTLMNAVPQMGGTYVFRKVGANEYVVRIEADLPRDVRFTVNPDNTLAVTAMTPPEHFLKGIPKKK